MNYTPIAQQPPSAHTPFATIASMNSQEEIKKLYRSKILAVRNYESEKDVYTVDDFLDPPTLVDIFEELFTGESDISPAGKSFVELYFDPEVFARTLVAVNFLRTVIRPASETAYYQGLLSWIKDIEPMEIATFIANAQGVDVDAESLEEDLLPPSGV